MTDPTTVEQEARDAYWEEILRGLQRDLALADVERADEERVEGERARLHGTRRRRETRR